MNNLARKNIANKLNQGFLTVFTMEVFATVDWVQGVAISGSSKTVGLIPPGMGRRH